MIRTTGWLFLNHMLHEPDVFKGRLGRSRENALVSCGSVLVSLMFSGLVVGQEPPRFRVRTDAHSVLDADVLREEARRRYEADRRDEEGGEDVLDRLDRVRERGA